jgi:preprotein translocase subunit SecE
MGVRLPPGLPNVLTEESKRMKQVVQNIGTYLSEVSVEFKKISWPERQELLDSTVVVLSFIVIMAVVVLCCDKVIDFVLQLIYGV